MTKTNIYADLINNRMWVYCDSEWRKVPLTLGKLSTLKKVFQQIHSGWKILWQV